MKRFIPFFALSAALLAPFTHLNAQDPEFTQFYQNPVYLNPGLIGSAEGARFASSYRLQWYGVDKAFNTYSLSYDQHFDKIGGGIGAQIWYDKAGDGRLSTLYTSIGYNYDIIFNDDKYDYFIVKTGLQAGGFQRRVDWDRLTFPDQFSPRYGQIYETKEQRPANERTRFSPDFNFGALAYTRNFYGGIAIHHLIEPGQSFFGNPESVLPRKYTAHLGMRLALDGYKRDPSAFITPNLLFQRQGKFTQINFGAYIQKNVFLAGISYRQTSPNSDALTAMLGIKYDVLQFGYSYDITVSGAREAARGAHELSLVVELPNFNHTRNKKWKAIPCPGFAQL